MDTLDKILKDIYGQDVVDFAYASPAGRLTKQDAKSKLTKLIQEAKIEENQRWIKLNSNTNGNAVKLDILISEFNDRITALKQE